MDDVQYFPSWTKHKLANETAALKRAQIEALALANNAKASPGESAAHHRELVGSYSSNSKLHQVMFHSTAGIGSCVGHGLVLLASA